MLFIKMNIMENLLEKQVRLKSLVNTMAIFKCSLSRKSQFLYNDSKKKAIVLIEFLEEAGVNSLNNPIFRDAMVFFNYLK